MSRLFSRRVLFISLGMTMVLGACATADHSVQAKAADLPATTGAPLTSTAPTTTSVPVTTVATTTTAAPTTTTTLAPTTTTVPPTTTTVAPTTLPPTTTIPAVPPLPAPLQPMRQGLVGEEVKVLQNRLLSLGFWIDAADGEYGWITQQAVMAFQKTYVDFNLKTTGNVDDATAAALGQVSNRVQGTIAKGDVIEVDKARQVLFITRGGVTLWALNTSTGTNEEYTEVNQKQGGNITDVAITPEGSFKVYNEYTKGWEKGQLGELYRPKYFKGGVAVHGSNSIPNYPASHGCVRITTTAMDWIWENDLLPLGTNVVVHS